MNKDEAIESVVSMVRMWLHEGIHQEDIHDKTQLFIQSHRVINEKFHHFIGLALKNTLR